MQNVEFHQYSSGGKLIFASFFFAVLSLLFPWNSTELGTLNGMEEETYLFLLFYLYPVYSVINNKHMDKVISSSFAVLATECNIAYIYSHNINIFQPLSCNLIGPYLFFVCSLLFVFATCQYEKVSTNNQQLLTA